MSFSIVTAPTNAQACVDFAKDPVPVAKEDMLAEIDSVPVLIHLDYLLDNAPFHIIAAAGAENLELPFNMLYQLKDDPEKLMSTFRDRLCIKIGLLTDNELYKIPFVNGATMTSCLCLPTVLKQFQVIHKQLSSSASNAAPRVSQRSSARSHT